MCSWKDEILYSEGYDKTYTLVGLYIIQKGDSSHLELAGYTTLMSYINESFAIYRLRGL